jgi:hypothetical protein
VGTDTDWTNISAGYAHSLGIKSDGTLWAWGASGQDQLGVGTVTNRKAPVRVGTDTDWTDITAGDFHSLGIKSDGTLWAWGYNYYGQLGDGTTLNKNTPSMLPNQDTDCDGVNNDVDNCPAVANPLQQDADTDTIGDACDSDTIYGTISGDIQAGVTVDLYITSCGGDILEATTVTDANGYYSLGDLSSQRYLLVAEETGYSFVPASDFVDIPQAEIQSYDFVATEIVRFIDNGDGTVKDTLTDLIWLKNANCYGHQDWYAAIDNATNLNSGECGLSDGSAEGDWHLATRDELQEIGTDPPTTWSSGMPDTWYMPGPPFVNVQSFYYWSSTEDGNGWAWFFAMSNGSMGMSSQDNKYRYVWPVRSGN